MNEEHRHYLYKEVDYKHYGLEQNLKKKFNRFFEYNQQICLYITKRIGSEKTIKIRKNQLESFYGEVFEKIENASKSKLKRIVKSRRPISKLYRELEIENFPFKRGERIWNKMLENK